MTRPPGSIPSSKKFQAKCTCQQLHPGVCLEKSNIDAMAAASSFINHVSSWPPATALRLEFKHVDGSIKYAYKFLVGFRGLSSWVVFQRPASGKFLHDDFGVSLSLQVFVSIAAPLQSQLVSNALLCVLACVSAVLCAPHVRLHLRYSWAWEAWSDGKTVTLADAACDNSSSQVCLTLDETEGIVFQVAERRPCTIPGAGSCLRSQCLG